VLGKLAFDRMTARLETWRKDLAAWEETSVGADFDIDADKAELEMTGAR
jgi:hypothetical protein